jgi:hypothetical protein
MFALIAAILFAIGYILDGAQVHTSAWFSPLALALLGLVSLAVHLHGYLWGGRTRTTRTNV